MKNFTFLIDRMLEQSETADIPVYRVVKDIYITVFNIQNSVFDTILLSLLHTIQSDFYYLIFLADKHYMLRKSIMCHNIPHYSDPTRCDIVDNNHEFRYVYSQIQVNISKLQASKYYIS